MRLRIPEALEERNLTAWHLANLSDGRIPLRTAYRMVERRGRVKLFSAELLQALCDVLKCEVGEILVSEPKRRRKAS
jgi:DNA-binding Xre family transcriptional regulator